jgi:succinate dehydrogenase hydrophobic anchor subunit
MNVARVSGIILVSLAVALLAWVLYDASDIVAFFGLGAYADEASVALLGLVLVAASMIGGVALIRASRRRVQSP